MTDSVNYQLFAIFCGCDEDNLDELVQKEGNSEIMGCDMKTCWYFLLYTVHLSLHYSRFPNDMNIIRATSCKNVSSAIFDQVRFKPVCSGTEAG